MKLKKFLICILVLAMLLMLPAAPGGSVALPADAATSGLEEKIDALEKEQAELEEQIKELQSQHKASLNKVEEILSQKDLIDQEIVLLNEQMELTQQQITANSALIAETTAQLEEAQAALKQMQEENAHRIMAMEKNSTMHTYWAVIFQAESFLDLLSSLRMYADIQAADRAVIQQLATAAEEVEEKQTQLQAQQEALEEARSIQEQTRLTLEQRRKEADELLQQAMEEEAEFKRLLAESEDKQDKLALEIAQAQKQHESIVNPPNVNDSGWMIPCSYVYVSDRYGMREAHPVTGERKMHYGIDLAAYQGTPIYATRSGTVTVAGFEAGGAGNYVYINHGDGYGSVYMHMTHYVVSYGQKVTQGQLIGYVGSTGGSTGPHLHFGISKNGAYVDPAPYIGL